MKYILNHEGKLYRKFFEEIAAIPHESFHEKELSDYIVRFAEKRGLWHRQDEIWNVIVKKPAAPGYEDHAPVMLQGHMDMVCVKRPGSDHNFETDPLQLYTEDGFLRARNTTLGADCGHGISYMLSILADDKLEHPPLECLFTVQEEVGVGGPKHLDYSCLSAKRLIFTDSMAEGKPELSTTSVLGGTYTKDVPLEPVSQDSLFFKIRAGGLAGGHAAVDINKGRANAVKILARAAYRLMKTQDIRICSFCGGTLKNNIPDKAELILAAEPRSAEGKTGDRAGSKAQIKQAMAELHQAVRQEHGKTDPDPFVTAEPIPAEEAGSLAMTKEDSRLLISWLLEIPSGTYAADPEDPSFPLTSRNLGTAELVAEENLARFTAGYMIRTSIKSHMEMLFDEMQILCGLFGARWEKEYDYPGYRTEPGGPMYQVYEEVYKEHTGESLQPVHIHAGTDVGTIMERMGGMDVIGIGPNTYKFHTPEEALDLASYDRAYQYIVGVLKRL